MVNTKKSFFEKLTGVKNEEEEEKEITSKNITKLKRKNSNDWIEEENDEAELTIDVYQTPKDIVIQAMVAGVKPEDLELTIARDMVTVRGTRAENANIDEEDYFTKELYWGKFSRTVLLPQEIEPEEVDAVEKHGLLTIKLQKVDKEKKNVVRVKSI